jgi:hypothetical protein
MSWLSSLRSRVAEALARRPFIRAKVAEALLQDGAFLDRAGQRIAADPARARALAERLLSDPAMDAVAAAHLPKGPRRIAAFLRSPAVFEELLLRLGKNPEALFRMLSDRRLRRQLLAQKSFLASFGADEVVLARLIGAMSAETRARAVALLVAEDAALLRRLADTPEALAAALALPREGVSGDEAALAALGQVFRSRMAEAAAPTLAALAERRPDLAPALLSHPGLRAALVEALAREPAHLAAVLEAAPVFLRGSEGPEARLRQLVELLADTPAFRRALKGDPGLRELLARLARSGASE